MGPKNAFYAPVQNDVTGIGEALFNDSHLYGEATLQGVVWMGTDWLDNPIPDGPDSVLGILAQEGGHRWCCNIRHLGEKGAPSSDLLGSPHHWSALLDTDASPMGGNDWHRTSPNSSIANPVSEVRFSMLDLYLMGLADSSEVQPLQLIEGATDTAGLLGLGLSPTGDRVTQPVTVETRIQEIEIQDVISVEGARGTGFDGTLVRQAWVYVTANETMAPGAALSTLEELAQAWPAYFSKATRGRGTSTVGPEGV